jgi:hypothetical protein
MYTFARIKGKQLLQKREKRVILESSRKCVKGQFSMTDYLHGHVTT